MPAGRSDKREQIGWRKNRPGAMFNSASRKRTLLRMASGHAVALLHTVCSRISWLRRRTSTCLLARSRKT